MCRGEIEALQEQLQQEAAARNRMEEDMKRAFMRGVCTASFSFNMPYAVHATPGADIPLLAVPSIAELAEPRDIALFAEVWFDIVADCIRQSLRLLLPFDCSLCADVTCLLIRCRCSQV